LDHLFGRPSKFSKIDSFGCNYKNDLCFRCDLQALSVGFLSMQGFFFPTALLAVNFSSQLDVTFGTCLRIMYKISKISFCNLLSEKFSKFKISCDSYTSYHHIFAQALCRFLCLNFAQTELR